MPDAIHMICMPYQNLTLSSLSVALLSSDLRERGHTVVESYLHFDFAAIVGQDIYRQISLGGTKTSFAGELLFSEDYHGAVAGDEANATLDRLFGRRRERREKLECFRLAALERVRAAEAWLTGFSTSNSQLFPSIWLARAIRREFPRQRIVFGGAACSSPMGDRLREAYPEISFVVSGWGEEPLRALAADAARPDSLLVNERQTPLDSLPIPDYRPFLDQAYKAGHDSSDLMLAFESSRGCWWGQKSHCTFCGLNQLEMAFNSKSSERVTAEVRTLWESHGVNLFATDTIMPRSAFSEVLPRLAEYESRPSIFYEVKANMLNEQVRLLRRSGVHWIQPGIESLSTSLLQHLRKGVSAIQNLALMKWCREEGIVVSWNLLCGIPGEAEADYRAQIDLVDKIPHFCPPQGVSPVRVDRYSPYFHSFQQFGWTGLKPFDNYRQLHPQLDDAAIYDIAYYFEAEGGDSDVRAYLSDLESCVQTWRRRNSAEDGLYWDPGQGLLRFREGEGQLLGVSEPIRRLIEQTHEISSVRRALQIPGVEERHLDQLADEGILYREGNQLLNLTARILRN